MPSTTTSIRVPCFGLTACPFFAVLLAGRFLFDYAAVGGDYENLGVLFSYVGLVFLGYTDMYGLRFHDAI